MNKTEALCQKCGKCCYFEIPLTILDIHRIAQYLNINDQKVFDVYVSDNISERSGLFSITKKQDRACMFLGTDKYCTIHNQKPAACRFYICSRADKKDMIPWTAEYSDLFEQAKLWEQSIASMITRAYIKKNGTAFNEADFMKSLLSIYDNILVNEQQKIKLARDDNNCPMGMVYDCSSCPTKGKCAKETVVSLDDLRKIQEYTGISWKNIFRKKVDDNQSKTDDLQLIRKGHCTFFDTEEGRCLIEEAQPAHCRFTPCPQRVKSDNQYDCFYLGAGSVEEQFRHQVSLAITKEYTRKYGTQYNSMGVKEGLKKIDSLLSNHIGFDDFCSKIASYRYVDDCIKYKHDE